MFKKALKALVLLYLLATLPLTALFALSDSFRMACVHEASRKIAHFRQVPFILMGDSLTAAGGYWGMRLGKTPFDAINLAVPGNTIAQILYGQVENGLRLKPRIVCLLAGTNDRIFGRTDDQIVTDFETLIAKLKVGGTPFIVTGIPVHATTAEDAPILALNRRLAEITTANGGNYLDLNPQIIASPDRASLFQGDGLHFAEPMYVLWTKALKDLVKSRSL